MLENTYRTTKEIAEVLKRTDKALAEVSTGKTEVILFGGASVLLLHRGTRWTHDVDVHMDEDQSGVGALFLENGIQVVPSSAMLVHPDYKKRLDTYRELNAMTVKILAPVDIAITKVARGHENDFYDLFNSDLATHFTLDEFRTLYREAAYGVPGPVGGTMGGWKKDRGSIEANLKRAEEIITRRKLLSENSTLFEERIREQVSDIAMADGHIVTCSMEDWKVSPPSIPREYQVLSFMMLSRQDKTALELRAAKDKAFGTFFYGQVMPSVRHFYDNVGKGLSDTPDVLSASNVLRGWMAMSGWSLGKSRRELIKSTVPEEGTRTLKIFTTLAGELMRGINPDKRAGLDQVFAPKGGGPEV